MTGNIRKGLGLLVVALIAAVAWLPAAGSANVLADMWASVAGFVAVVCGLLGLGYLATGLLRQSQPD